MGQHKHNPTAIAAKEGKLPPKPPKKSKKERDRELQAMVWQAMMEKSPATAALVGALSQSPYSQEYFKE